MRLYRGDSGSGAEGATWYAADPDYAAFFGALSEIEVDADAILDLRHLGVANEADDGYDDARAEIDALDLPEYRDVELYLWAERENVQAALREAGYRGVRLMQWHADYADGPQDTTLIL